MITRPLLAATLEDVTTLQFPVLATPKLDGIRVLKVDGKAVTRKFKPIPNTYIRGLLEKHLPDGIDGEIMTPGTFNEIQSKVMSFDGQPEFTFYAFDYVKDSLTKSYKDRMLDMLNVLEPVVKDSTLPFSVNLLTPVLVRTVEELLELESQCLEFGCEGVMIRSPGGKYKCGRSTPKEQILMKLKRFLDAEAIVVGFEEKMHNDNTQEHDEFGLAKRSSKKAGMIPTDTLGSLIVQDVTTRTIFNIGTGFDDATKKEIWTNQDKYLKKLVKYKYQSVGQKNAPRFPVFLGFRNELDL